jgi:predicted secreted protein
MNITAGLVIYVISWWMVFFMMLPLGVKAQDEDGEEAVPGTHTSAPKNPNLLKKSVYASFFAAIIWGLI